MTSTYSGDLFTHYLPVYTSPVELINYVESIQSEQDSMLIYLFRKQLLSINYMYIIIYYSQYRKYRKYWYVYICTIIVMLGGISDFTQHKHERYPRIGKSTLYKYIHAI